MLTRLKGLISRLPQSYFFDFRKKKKTVFIASSGRSGSTWLQNIVSAGSNYRTLFEPFFYRKVKFLENWHVKQYICRHSPGHEYYSRVKRVLEGRFRNQWIDQDNQRFFSNARLIKDIRVNLFIAWIKVNFPAIKIIYLLRHPFAVAKSQIRMEWPANLDIFYGQQALMNEHPDLDRSYLESITNRFCRHIAYWCVENLVALRELNPNDALVVSYEDLKSSPSEEAKKIYDFLGDKMPHSFKETTSSRSRTDNYLNSSTRYSPTSQEIEEAWKIVEHFGLDYIYSINEKSNPSLVSKDILEHYQTPS